LKIIPYEKRKIDKLIGVYCKFSKPISEDNKPAEEEIEKANWVHGQLLPVLRYHFFDEMYATVRGPAHSKSDVNNSNYDVHVASN